MPRIIFTSQYMRDAPPAQLENYVKYIGTREGVEKIDESMDLNLRAWRFTAETELKHTDSSLSDATEIVQAIISTRGEFSC